MQMNFIDNVALSDAATRETPEGYLVVQARVARTGIQTYKGSELGINDRDTIRLYRPEDEVFKQGSMSSYAHRPVTLDHPKQMVDASNWKKTAVGQTGEEVVRDGSFVRVPMVIMDADAIKAVKSGVRELSMGYSCNIELVDGVTPDGQPYDAIQRDLRMNHLAIVPVARGGSQLRIGDNGEQPMNDIVHKTRTVLVDGLQVEATDASATAIEKLLKERTALTDAAKEAEGKHQREIAAKDAEIDSFKKQVLTDADLDKRVAERVAFVDKARKIMPTIAVDGKSISQLRREIVVAKVGDSVKDKGDEYIEARFDLLADADPIRQPGGQPFVNPNVNLADKAYADSQTELSQAWMGNQQKTGS
jgi:uncharacterized protein